MADGAGILLIVMGVSGAGKSSVAQQVAAYLKVPFKDGDELHPKANIDKMTAGQPLNDEDRIPWLKDIRQYAHDNMPSESASRRVIVIACSALKKSYRDLLRGESGVETWFLYLDGSHDLLVERMKHRTGHFMKTSMLESQLATLENPSKEEHVITISIDADLTTVIGDACKAVDAQLPK